MSIQKVVKKLPVTKGNILIGIVISLVFVSAAIAGYFYWQKQNTQNKPIQNPVQQKTNPGPTANWKTYTDKVYGYSVDFPSQWKISEKISDPKIGSGIKSVTFGENLPSVWPGSLTIEVVDIANDKPLNDWIKHAYQLDLPPSNSSVREGDRIRAMRDITVGNSPAKKLILFAFDRNDQVIFISRDRNIYSITSNDSNANDPDFQKHREIYQKIISTFKFL